MKKRHRFILSYAAFRGSHLDLADASLTHQLRTVLRLQPGEEVILSDGDDTEVVARITGYDADVSSFDVIAKNDISGEPARVVTLYAAITKRDSFEWLCQKAVECGVTRIVSIRSERTIKQDLNLDRLRTIVKEAAEQSGRGRIPQVAEITSFADALSDDSAVRYLASLENGEVWNASVLTDVHRVSLLIGPEGGWSPAEEEAARGAGWTPVSFGPRVLRAETAGIIGVFLLSR